MKMKSYVQNDVQIAIILIEEDKVTQIMPTMFTQFLSNFSNFEQMKASYDHYPDATPEDAMACLGQVLIKIEEAMVTVNNLNQIENSNGEQDELPNVS